MGARCWRASGTQDNETSNDPPNPTLSACGMQRPRRTAGMRVLMVLHASCPCTHCMPSPQPLPRTATSMPGMRSASARGPTTVSPGCAFFSARLPPTWSMWWCCMGGCVIRGRQRHEVAETHAAGYQVGPHVMHVSGPAWCECAEKGGEVCGGTKVAACRSNKTRLLCVEHPDAGSLATPNDCCTTQHLMSGISRPTLSGGRQVVGLIFTPSPASRCPRARPGLSGAVGLARPVASTLSPCSGCGSASSPCGAAQGGWLGQVRQSPAAKVLYARAQRNIAPLQS